MTEPELASWSEVELHLAQYEQVLHEQPALREHVLTLAGHMRRYSRRIPGTMPPAVAQAFARLGA